MALPNEPITLGVAQISELNRKLADLRHDVNNCLSLINAAAELLRRRPESAERLLDSINEQPPKVAEIVARFSHELETALHITRP